MPPRRLNRPNVGVSGYLLEHRKFFVYEEDSADTTGDYKKGDIIVFTYDGVRKWVYVIADRWSKRPGQKELLHGLDLKYIPRAWLIRIMSSPEDWSSKQLYDRWLRQPVVRRYDAYRSFNPDKMSDIRRVGYDARPQEGEESLSHLDEDEGKIT